MRCGLFSAAVVATGRVNGGCCCPLRRHGSVGGDFGRGGLGAVEVTPPPPRPASYVPPEERAADDASLSFLRRKEELRGDGVREEEGGLRPGPGQSFAPSLPSRPPCVRRYTDEAAARLQSTSVHAGHDLLPHRSKTPTSRLGLLRNATPESRETKGASKTAFRWDGPEASVFENRDRFGYGEGNKGTEAGDRGGNAKNLAQQSKPVLQQLELDLRRLEYYQGTPQYPELLKEFRAKYGSSDDGKSSNRGDGSNQEACKMGECLYSPEELRRGLDAQPIDYLRASSKLKVELSSGPRAYDPVIVMQQFGVMQFQGYAFPPTTELGKLRDREGRELQSNEENVLKGHMRQNASSVIKAQLAAGRDNHFLYRTLGLDAIQRRQARAMLSDFDYGDRQTAFHVMMSYPYTDWVHVFYMVLVGVALYKFQLYCGAYEFYDEYLGMDLRQVPRLKKPFLAVVTVVAMVVVFFHPLLVASIATTRFYRIAMGRPIGPP